MRTDGTRFSVPRIGGRDRVAFFCSRATRRAPSRSGATFSERVGGWQASKSLQAARTIPQGPEGASHQRPPARLRAAADAASSAEIEGFAVAPESLTNAVRFQAEALETVLVDAVGLGGFVGEELLHRASRIVV